MFKINPGEAKTDLYGIGKGEAQVFDTSQTERAALFAQKQKAAAERLKQKQEADRLGDISKQLGAMSSVAYMPRDRELIAGKTQGVKDYVLKNVDKLTKGDPASMIEFQNLYGDLKSTAEQSKNAREFWEQEGNKIASNPGLYRPEAIDYHMGFAGKEHMGDFAYDATQLKHNVDYGKHVLDNLLPAAQKMARQNGYNTDFTPEQAKQLIADDLDSSDVKFEQVAYDFNKANPEELARLGNPKNAKEYAQAKFSPQLVVKDRKPIPMSERNGGDNRKLPKVAGTYTDQGNGKGEFQFEYTNTADNPYLTIQQPGTKQAIEIKPQKVIFDGKNTRLQALTKPGKDDAGIDVPGKEITLDYNYVSDIMANKFGIKNVYDIKEGSDIPDHVTVKRVSVPAGQEKKYSVKGKEYSHSAVEKAAKASGMSVEEYLKAIGK